MPSAFPVPGDEVRAAAIDDDRSTLREEGEVHVCSSSRHAGMLPCVRECASSSRQTMGCLYSHSLNKISWWKLDPTSQEMLQVLVVVEPLCTVSNAPGVSSSRSRPITINNCRILRRGPGHGHVLSDGRTVRQLWRDYNSARIFPQMSGLVAKFHFLRSRHSLGAEKRLWQLDS